MPTTSQQLRGFPGMTGFCKIWIPNFDLLAKLLYETLKGMNQEPLTWTVGCQKAFQTIKEKLLMAPAKILWT